MMHARHVHVQRLLRGTWHGEWQNADKVYLHDAEGFASIWGSPSSSHWKSRAGSNSVHAMQCLSLLHVDACWS
jgi:hypothetical protein